LESQIELISSGSLSYPTVFGLSRFISMANNATPYVTGFGSFSSFLSSDKDRTTVVFKRFDKLALRDLLYYQSELAALQEQQDRFDREDAIEVKQMTAAWDEIRVNARDWTSFSDAAKRESGSERWKERMELAMRIRETLKNYSESPFPSL